MTGEEEMTDEEYNSLQCSSLPKLSVADFAKSKTALLGSLRHQLGTAKSQLLLNNCLDHVVLWACQWGIVLIIN